MKNRPEVGDTISEKKQENLDIVKPEIFNEVVSGINELRDKITDQNPDEQEKILKIFERIFRAAYEKEK